MRYVYIYFLDGSVHRFTKELEEDYEILQQLIFLRVENMRYNKKAQKLNSQSKSLDGKIII